MNRNVVSHFATLPSVNIGRSTFDRGSTVKTSFDVGKIVPFYIDEVLPGDTFDVRTSRVVRMPSLITPIMDNLYLDHYYFFVPNRLVWSHWREFNGENTKSAWIPQTEYEIPQITAPAGGWDVGTIADYLGVPTGVPNLSVNALPFRAYALIVNEWFRDQNLMDPLNIPLDDATVTGVNTDTFVTDVAKGGKPYIASKYRDYFTSCLPAPQKGEDVEIPVAKPGNLPVFALDQDVDFEAGPGFKQLKWYGIDPSSTGWQMMEPGAQQYSSVIGDEERTKPVGIDGLSYATPANLWALQDGSAAAATINQLRLAFQIQKLYERDARGGTRYTEILKSHFGVTSPDARLQRPEYLGGARLPITINQVIQNSASDAQPSPLGTTGAMSLTTDVHSDFKRSFTEHGFVIGVMVARYNHTYQQGLDRLFSRKSRFDYYWPVFANIGEQAVLNKEIYAQGTAEDEEVFGYQEAWADYRYKPNRITGQMRSQYAQSLDVWHLGDDYGSIPRLSAEWMREDSVTVDRVLAVSQENASQLFADIYVANRCTRPMPMYSVPGLIDHH